MEVRIGDVQYAETWFNPCLWIPITVYIMVSHGTYIGVTWVTHLYLHLYFIIATTSCSVTFTIEWISHDMYMNSTWVSHEYHMDDM